METKRWINQTQPQTLFIAVLLMYFEAGILALFGLGLGLTVYTLIVIVGFVAAGWGISNEHKWGYYLGVALTGAIVGAYFVQVAPFTYLPTGGLIGLLFDIAKFALLLHPQSREYQRIWFK